MLRQFFLLSLCLSAAFFSGCASKQIAYQDEFESLTSAKAEAFEGDSERALNDAEAAFEAAKQAELELYAPLHMAELQQALKQARSLELEGDSDASIITSAKVVALTEAGLQNKQKVEALLPELIRQKAVLDDIEARNILPSDYRDNMESFRELISQIESGDDAGAGKGAASVLIELQQLELNTMLKQHWQPAQDTLEQAEDEDADSNAVKTFEYAEQLVDNADRKSVV